MATDNYNPETSRSLYNPAASNQIARLWAREKTLHDLADFGAVEFFEGGGTNPTALTGYATNKLWLRVEDGVTTSCGTVRYYAGGDATLLASWPEVDRRGFSSHIGARSGVEFDYVWSTATSGDPGTGKVRGNNATLGSITQLAISESGRQGQAYGTRIADWAVDDIVRVYAVGDETAFVDVVLTAAPVDVGVYYTVACTVRASSAIASGALVGIGHWPTSRAISETAANAAAAQAAETSALAAEASAALSASVATAAEANAEAARDAAFTNANVYADIATGRAAVSDGQQFMVPDGDGLVRYRRDSSSTQTEMARYPAGAKLCRVVLGLSDTSSAGTAWTSARSYAIGRPSPIAGFVRKVYIKSLAVRPVRIFVADMDGGNLKLVRYVRINTTGVGHEAISLTEDLPVAAGQYVGAYWEVGAPYYVVASGDGSLFCTDGFVTNAGIAWTSNTSITLGLGFEIEGQSRFEWSRTTDKTLEAAQNWSGETWCALGTSLTLPGYYTPQVAARIGADLINFGASGQTWSGSSSSQRIIYERGRRVDPRADLITIEGPINDFRLSRTLGSVRGTDPATCLGALYGMVEDMQEANPFRSIAVIASPANMDAGYAGKWNAANGNGVFWNDYIDAVEQQARWMGVETIRPFGMSGITSKWHTSDLLHPDEKTGAVQFANSVSFGISSIPKTRVVQCETPVVAFNIGTNQATITCATSGSSIYYTTNGTNPTTSSTLYSGAFTPADGDIEIRAIAVKSGLGRSPQRRSVITKNTSSGLGSGTWNMRPAVVGDITSTRGVVRSLEGGRNWSVDVEPAPSGYTAIWLASGSNNACEFEIAFGEETQIAVGIGSSGWIALGWFRINSVYTLHKYELAAGTLTTSTFSPALPHSSNEPSRRYRVARVGNILHIYENAYGTWTPITTTLDVSALSGVTGYYETSQIGVVQDTISSHAPVKNVRVGTLV